MFFVVGALAHVGLVAFLRLSRKRTLAVRAERIAGLKDVEAVVLESNGSHSVVTAQAESDFALAGVPGVAGRSGAPV
jgi:hypothetical protein